MHQVNSSCEGTGRPSFASAYWIEPVMPGFGSVRVPSRSKKIARSVGIAGRQVRSEEHTSELQSQSKLVCRLLLEKKKNTHLVATITPRKYFRLHRHLAVRQLGLFPNSSSVLLRLPRGFLVCLTHDPPGNLHDLHRP